VRPLAELEVLIVDCQATAASPRGHLLEIGWARACAGAAIAATTADSDVDADGRACLIKLPEGEPVPTAVARITGISEAMTREGVEPSEAWRALLEQAARIGRQPAPTVAHFARFERPFLHALAGDQPLPLDLVCTHDIAQRLLPDLPRRGLRALTGYFGRDLGPLRRSAEHVGATAFVWRELVRLLDEQGVTTWDSLRDWLAAPVVKMRPGQQRRRVWPMPRDVRLAAPDAPGLYRMQRTDGSVLYVGKASSLSRRVNSYFRKQRGVPDRLLEMLSQARALTCEVTESTLEAALLEPDEIKRHRPPYNVALMDEPRHIWFTTRDLGERSAQPSPQHPIGPFTSAMTLDRFAALANGSPTALGFNPRATEADARLFAEGYARFRAAHQELSREADNVNPRVRLLRLGTRLWREGRRDRESAIEEEFRLGDQEMPEDVQSDLERVALRAALARRRAKWVTRLVDASIVWREAAADRVTDRTADCATDRARLIVIEHGEILTREWVDPNTTPPVPPGHARRRDARHEGFTVARFDRLRVLMTELKRLLAEGAPVALRLDDGSPLADARLAAALSWV
jgi:DNA polymerase III subunit epsilon